MDWDAYHAETTKVIEEHGWTVQLIVDSECPCGACKEAANGDSQRSPFAYTVGMYSRQRPEIVMFGLPPDVMHGLCNDVAKRIIETPEDELVDGLLLEQILRGYAAKIRVLGRLMDFKDQEEVEHFGYLLKYAQHQNADPTALRAIQVLWPDPDGAFPDDPTCLTPKAAQPLLRGARE